MLNAKVYRVSAWEAKRNQNDHLTFVKDEQLAATDDGPSQGENLALTDREIGSTAGDLGVEGDTTLFNVLLQGKESSGTKSVVQARIVVLVKWIQILAEASAQKLRLEVVVGQSCNRQRGLKELTI